MDNKPDIDLGKLFSTLKRYGKNLPKIHRASPGECATLRNSQPNRLGFYWSK